MNSFKAKFRNFLLRGCFFPFLSYGNDWSPRKGTSLAYPVGQHQSNFLQMYPLCCSLRDGWHQATSTLKHAWLDIGLREKWTFSWNWKLKINNAQNFRMVDGVWEYGCCGYSSSTDGHSGSLRPGSLPGRTYLRSELGVIGRKDNTVLRPRGWQIQHLKLIMFSLHYGMLYFFTSERTK